MGVRPTFSNATIEKYLEAEAQKLHQKILKAFFFVGERCAAEARINKTYLDQTGNLTASIGYVVSYNGIVQTVNGFQEGNGTSSGGLGKAKGEGLARSLASQQSIGYCLVVVAGMNYAYAVEARGRNVLSSAELLAESILPKLLIDLKIK